MLPLGAFVMLSSTQVAVTVPSRFLLHEGAAYVASPVYPIKSASADERFCWSQDGSRLAIVSAASTDSPTLQARRLAKGEMPYGPMRLSVWSRDTGRVRDVFATSRPEAFISHIGFIGRDLLFSTGSGAPTGGRVWMVRNDGATEPLTLPGFAGHFVAFVPSPRGNGVVVSGKDGLWLVSPLGIHTLNVPKGAILVPKGVLADGRAALRIDPGSGTLSYRLIEFVTGSMTSVEELPDVPNRKSTYPFILDGYALRGTKTLSAFEDPDSTKVDGGNGFVNQFEGGGLLDLVERTGSPRRRMRFLNETARLISLAPDGLSFAFVSNGVLMVRYLVRCDAAATKRLLESP